MRADRLATIRERTDLLIAGFPRFLAFFEKRPPFTRFGQYEFHRQVIDLRREAGSVLAALDSPRYIKLLYRTLRAWGIGSRRSKLLPFDRFEDALHARRMDMAGLEGLMIDQPDFDVEDTLKRLWGLIQSLQIVDNKARLVACSKELHHLLPEYELVVPIDRDYTRNFFGWHGPEFQNRQRPVLRSSI
jgi:hypothetical protein